MAKTTLILEDILEGEDNIYTIDLTIEPDEENPSKEMSQAIILGLVLKQVLNDAELTCKLLDLCSPADILEDQMEGHTIQ